MESELLPRPDCNVPGGISQLHLRHELRASRNFSLHRLFIGIGKREDKVSVADSISAVLQPAAVGADVALLPSEPICAGCPWLCSFCCARLRSSTSTRIGI